MQSNPLNNLTPIQLQLLATFGPIIGMFAGYFAAWRGIDQASATGIIMAVIVGALTIYNAWVARPTAQVTSVAQLPEVKEISLNKEVAGVSQLESVTPDNVVMK